MPPPTRSPTACGAPAARCARGSGTPGAWSRRWVAGSALAAVGLLLAVLAISALAGGTCSSSRPNRPFAVGDAADVAGVLGHNLLVLALHAMACVAGFIAGSSLPLQAASAQRLSRWVHEHGGRIAIAFVVVRDDLLALRAGVRARPPARGLRALPATSPPALLLLGVLPHAMPELIALFLPLAAWIIASRRGEWDQLLAATLVTVASPYRCSCSRR